MNILTDGLKKLVASFDANQRAIIKTTAHDCLAKYSGHLPGFIINWVNSVIDKFMDRFMDDTA